MFERRHQPLLPRGVYLLRVLKSALLALGILGSALGIGVLGYHHFEKLSWVDSLLNASMLLGGMGPIDTDLKSNGSKVFASAYALFSGLVFISVAGVLLAPLAHRFLHRFHLEEESKD